MQTPGVLWLEVLHTIQSSVCLHSIWAVRPAKLQTRIILTIRLTRT